MPQDLGRGSDWASKQPPRFKNLLSIQAPEGNFPALPRTRRASPSPGSRRLLRSERRQARRAGVAAATSSPTSPAEAGRPRRESRKEWGARALPGAERRRGKEGRSWEAVTGRRAKRPVRDRDTDGSPGAQGRVRSQPRANEHKAPGSHPSAPPPLRPQPRRPLRRVTRTAHAGSGYHWCRTAPCPAPDPGRPAPFRAAEHSAGEPPAALALRPGAYVGGS